MAGWVPALRIARRDAWRKGSGSRGRSILVLVMIALPVLAVSAADVVYLTSDVNRVESLEQRIGAADAQVQTQTGYRTVYQGADPGRDGGGGSGNQKEPVSLETVREILGRDVPATERAEGGLDVETDRGVVVANGTELDTSSPLVRGLFRLTSGTWPAVSTEVTVNEALAGKGFEIGSTVTVRGGAEYTVSGVAESTQVKGYPAVLGPPGAFYADSTTVERTLLIGGGPVSWDEVRAVNAVGAFVVSRQVVEHPPPDPELPAEMTSWSSGTDDAYIAALVLVVVMALLEVVLLAGPAFAVGARRQQRTLALMAASGGTPKQARRVILAGGVVLGATAAVLGVVLGLVVGWAVLPVVQHFSDNWLGPFEVNPLHLMGIACFGLLSAFLAAVVPAWLASRQDVVAVLAGRRGDRRPGYRSPLLGLALLLGGIGLSVAGTRGDGEILIAAAAVVSVLGMILLVPVVVAVLARFSRRLPLVTRYAVRDAARHRTRTVPAVAAVAATVAGVVALGIANASDAAESEATYQPSMPMGRGWLNVSQQDVDYTPFEQAIAREAPAVTYTEVRSYDAYQDDVYYDIRVHRPGVPGYDSLLSSHGAFFGTLLEGAPMLDLVQPQDDADLSRARTMLASGGLVVFTSDPVDTDRIRVSGRIGRSDGGEGTKLTPVELPAYFLEVSGAAPGLAIAPPGALDPTGLTASTAGLALDAQDLTTTDEDNLREVVQGLNENAFLYVERGYQQTNETLILLGILFGLGAVLMLGGTLTATFLALSDARPDLATLAAVGAAPRTRRGVAAAYALVVGFVGAVLGAAVGFIPGVAITYPLTSLSVEPGQTDRFGVPLPTHFVDVPWLFVIGLVVVLPLVTALIVGLTARSRLPLVARLD